MATVKLDRFTNREIEKIPPPEKGITVVIPAEKRPIVCAIITKNSNRSFYARASINGAGQRIAIPGGNLKLMTVSEARKSAPKIIAKALKGDTPAKNRRVKKQNAVTLRQLMKEYLDKQQRKLDKPMKSSTAEDYESRILLSFDSYMDKPITAIDRSTIEYVMEVRGKKCLSALRVLKAIFNYAIKEGRPLTNPVPEKLASYGRKQTYLKEAYISDWFNALDKLKPDAKEYFLFLLFTGVRADSEAGQLTWDRIDWKSESFLLTNTKNQRDVELPLPSYMVPILKDRKKKQGLVFPGGEYREEREMVAKSIDYHFTRHDLRRTFMTIAEGIDVSWLAVKRLSNHISQEHGVTEGYVIVNLERLRRASRLIEAEILHLANREY